MRMFFVSPATTILAIPKPAAAGKRVGELLHRRVRLAKNSLDGQRPPSGGESAATLPRVPSAGIWFKSMASKSVADLRILAGIVLGFLSECVHCSGERRNNSTFDRHSLDDLQFQLQGAARGLEILQDGDNVTRGRPDSGKPPVPVSSTLDPCLRTTFAGFFPLSR